jgi:hypothetical protein
MENVLTRRLLIRGVDEWQIRFSNDECLFCMDKAIYFVDYRTSAMRCCTKPECITKAIKLAVDDAENWIPSTTWKVGDRVKRDGKTGTVKIVYSNYESSYAPYPELYAVRWDDGEIGLAYLPHGLLKDDKQPHNPTIKDPGGIK